MKLDLVLLSLLLVFLPTAGSSTDLRWKVLNCGDGKFSFEYPDNWTVYYDHEVDLKRNPGAIPAGIAGPVETVNINGRSVAVDFNCFKQCGSASAGVYTPKGLRSIMIGSGDRFTQFSNEHEIMLGNEPADQLFSYSNQESNQSPFLKQIFVVHDRIGLAIAVGELGPGAKDIKSENDWKYKAEIDHILASFRFFH